VEDHAGIDIAAMDPAVSPCENFYRFACGTWIAKNPLPADRSRWSRFDSLGEGNLEKLRRILEAREPLYRKADMRLDTSGSSVDESFAKLKAALHANFA